jgi:hypothetical protein
MASKSMFDTTHSAIHRTALATVVERFWEISKVAGPITRAVRSSMPQYEARMPRRGAFWG